MRACVIAAAIVAFSQPALAAKTHKKSPHRHHVAHLSHQHHAKHHRTHARLRRTPIESGYAAPQTFVRTNATDTPIFSDPSLPNRSSQASATPAPRFESGVFAPRAAPFGFAEATPRVRVA